MRDAVAEDFGQLDGVEVFDLPGRRAAPSTPGHASPTPPDARTGAWSSPRRSTASLAESVEAVCARPAAASSGHRARRSGLTSDKLALADHWRDTRRPDTRDHRSRRRPRARHSRSCGSRATAPVRPTRFSSATRRRTWRGQGRARSREPTPADDPPGVRRRRRGERRVPVRPRGQRPARAGLPVAQRRRAVQVPRRRAADPAGPRGRARRSSRSARSIACRGCSATSASIWCSATRRTARATTPSRSTRG